MPVDDMFSEKVVVSRTAFFLDLDGTLAEIVDDPRGAFIQPATLRSISRLSQAAGGALAVVSGRSIAQLDKMLEPLRLPLAGVHGLERRDASGTIIRTEVDELVQSRLVQAVSDFVSARPGLLAEAKPGSVALHYRQRPELAQECGSFAIHLTETISGIKLVAGKMVIEMKLADRTKGDAISEFMLEAPFIGRRPFFAGDDVTDEAGFEVVNVLAGISVKVGPGETCAAYRVRDVASFAKCFEQLL